LLSISNIIVWWQSSTHNDRTILFVVFECQPDSRRNWRGEVAVVMGVMENIDNDRRVLLCLALFHKRCVAQPSSMVMMGLVVKKLSIYKNKKGNLP